jgi:PAS domain S-box-containing protein
VMHLRILPKRLDLQVILLSSLMLGTTMFFFAYHEARDAAEHVVESVTLQAKALAQNIAVTSIDHLVTNDFAANERLLLLSARFPGVLSIQVTDVDGRVIGDAMVPPGSQPQLRYQRETLEPPTDVVTRVAEQQGQLVIWEPVVNGPAVGWVRLTYSLAEAEARAQQRLQDFLIDGAILTSLLMLLIALVLRRPVSMIRAASAFAGQLQDKNGAQMPVDRSSVEIEQLGVALNMASSKLFEQDSAIKRALSELNTQKLALDEHSIVCITDVQGHITYANQKFLDVTGFAFDELQGKSYQKLSSGSHDKEFFRDMWTTIQSGSVWRGEILNTDKRGYALWMDTTIVPFMDATGTPYEFVAISTDVTEQKNIARQLEQKARSLQEMTDHLEDLVKQRTSALEDANAKLQRLNNVKSEFVSIVSHELRTPLTSIKSFAEILEDDIEDLAPEEQRRYLSIINEESDRLGRLINDLLDLQKMDTGKMSWKDERVNLAKLVKNSAELFGKAYGDKGLPLQLDIADGEFPVDVDGDRIKQLIANLLSNAMKFTESGAVTLALRPTMQNLRVLVVDADATLLESLRRRLTERGIEVSTCEDGGAALDHLRQDWRATDMVISDIHLPGMDGLDLLKTIRASAPQMPVLMTSEYSDENALKRLLTYHATYYVEKPLSMDRLEQIMEKAMGKALDAGASSPMVEVSVTDTGLGIPEQDLNKVFESFHQVDSSQTREIGGSGLGLAICKEIVEHYKGRIWVKSTLGEGSRFTLSLPLADTGKKRLGQILVEAGVVSEQQIEQALASHQ